MHNSSLLIKRYIIDQLDLSQFGALRKVKFAAVKHAEEECHRGDAAVSSHFEKLGFLLFTDFVQIQSYFLHIQKQSVWIVLPPDC